MKIGSGSSGTSQDYAAQRVSEGAAPVEAPKVSQKAETKMDTLKKDKDQNKNSEFTEEWMKKSVDQANKTLVQHNRFIERDIHPVTHTVMYKIMDTNTNEMIAEYPPKKIQDMVAKMWELAGLFVDERA